MPGSFAYNVSSNTVTVTGGTAGSPADFASFVSADRAGTLASQDTRNITAVDGSPVAVTRAIRPVERLVLGGSAQTLYLVVTNWNASSATVRLAGTDYDGNAQQEDIAISGNGTLYTVNRYKTITSTQVTVLSGTGFTYTLTQAGWGVIWDFGSGQYQIDCYLQIGDGSTSTYLQDQNKYIGINSLTANNQTIISVKANATFELGTLIDAVNKTTAGGCLLLNLKPYYGTLLNLTNSTTCKVHLYSCVISSPSFSYSFSTYVPGGSGLLLYNCISDRCFRPCYMYSNSEIFNYQAYGTNGFAVINCPASKILMTDSYYVFTSNGANAINVSDVIVRNCTAALLSLYNQTADINLTNVDSNNWNISWAGTCTAKVYRKYTLDLHLTDIDGNNISGATVTLKDNGGNTVFSVSTGADGKIVQQTVSQGYYDQTHGNTLQDNGPHTLIVTVSGYQDYQDVMTIDRQMDLEVAMLTTVTGSGGGVSPTNLGLVPLGIKQVAI